MFAVGWGIEQLVHESRIRPGRRIGEEGGDVVRRGREAGEVKVEPAGERARGGLRRGLGVGGLELGEDKGVDRVLDPLGLPDRRGGGIGDGLEGPEIKALAAEDLHDGIAGIAPRIAQLADGGFGFGHGGVRPGRAVLDPALDAGDLFLQELVLGGHLAVCFQMADQLEEEALLRIAGDEGGAVLAAHQGRLAGVQAELALLLLFAVAAHAGILKHRPNPFLEVRFRGGLCPGHGPCEGFQKEKGGNEIPHDSVRGILTLKPLMTAVSYVVMGRAATGF